MIAFLDTDVLVDCWRGTKLAQDWLTNVQTEVFQVLGIVAMEMTIGCRNNDDLRRVEKFLSVFDVVWPASSKFALAYDLLKTHYLGSRLGISDCLIASMALSRSACLYTFNLKHFIVVTGLDVRQPYLRSEH